MTALSIGTAAIARHEATAMWRDGRLRAVALLVLLLLVAAVASGARYSQQLARERAVAAADERARWLGQGEKNPHSAAHYGLYAFKPGSPLALADRGIEPFVGVGVWLEAHKMNTFAYRPAQDGGTVARFGELTAALSLQVLLPLLIILAGYGSFAAERERGTLRQVLASGVQRRALVRGKLLAMLGGVAVIAVPGAILYAVAVAFWHGSAVEPARFIGLLVAYAIYLLGWAMLTLAVSAFARTARSALVILFGLWVLGCVAGPRLAYAYATGARPAPSAIAFQQAIAADTGAAHSTGSTERALAMKAQIFRAYGVTRQEDLPFDWRGITLQKEEERNYPIFERRFNALFDTYRAQDRLTELASLVVPSLSIAALSEGLAGTDFEHHRRFIFAAEQHRRVIQKQMNRDVYLHDREGVDYRAPESLWKSVPPFLYRSPSLGTMWPHYRLATLMLFLWAALATAAAFWAARRLRA